MGVAKNCFPLRSQECANAGAKCLRWLVEKQAFPPLQGPSGGGIACEWRRTPRVPFLQKVDMHEALQGKSV
jgi:hypothetical protein